jgi:hypothetical protein
MQTQGPDILAAAPQRAYHDAVWVHTCINNAPSITPVIQECLEDSGCSSSGLPYTARSCLKATFGHSWPLY